MAVGCGMVRVVALLFLLVLGLPGAVRADQPDYNANDWNFVLVPSFDADGNTRNLTIGGLNQSLRFAQTLALQTTGKQQALRQVIALLPQPAQAPLTPGAVPTYLAPLQSVEPFALLTNQGIAVTPVTVGSTPGSYGTAAYWVQQILANNPKGLYVIGLPPDLVAEVAQALTGQPMTTPLPPNSYLVIAGPGTALVGRSFATNAIADPTPPRVTLPPPAQSCPQTPVNFTVPAPAGLQFYANRQVTFVRHVEAHPTSGFENGNYVCQGQWRALGAVPILQKLMQIPGTTTGADAVISSDPTNPIACSGSCSYIRPLLTVTPFAITQGLPVTVAPFQWTDYVDLAHWLFNQASPYAIALPSNQPKNLLVGWEHDHLVKAVRYLVGTVYQAPDKAAMLPDWNFQDYDSVWTVRIDSAGTLTFDNSCEKIATASLPGICPAFLP